jgi:hypothetical protein
MFYVQLAVVLRRRNRLGEAEQWLLKAYELADGLPLRAWRSFDVACEMAELLTVQGRLAEATEWERKAEILEEGIRGKYDRKQRGLPE